MTTQAERIERGVEFLDRKVGEQWPGRINLEDLDLGNSQFCVLGQTMGWWTGLGVIHSEGEMTTEYAFNSNLMRGERYTSLTTKWRTKIRKLKKERGIE